MIKLFTHTDLDGVGCAILAQLAFGDELREVSYCNYSNIDEEVTKCIGCDICECHITDIRVTEETAKQINSNETIFKLFDHHPTALGLNTYDWCTVDIVDENEEKTSGTAIYYKYLVENDHLKKSDVLDRFVKLVTNYDTWKWSTMGEDGLICKQVNDLYYLYGKKSFISWCISQIHDEVFPRLYEKDKFILNIKQKEINAYIEKKNKQIMIKNICGMKCGVVFAENYPSELGNRLCTLNPELDFVAIVNMDGKIDYRTVKNNIDLGKDVAPVFGGGGHPKAAGSQISDDVKMEIVNKLFNIEK